MARTAGIALVDLFELADLVESVLPPEVRNFIERFVVVGHHTSHSDSAIFHFGTLLSIADATHAVPTDFNIAIGRLSVPLLQTGIPFQLAFQRRAGAGNLEPSAQVWRLDVWLDVFTLTVNGLEPAIYVPDSGTTPRHLVRDPTRSDVRITGSAVLRIEKPSPGALVEVKFVDEPDPLDPGAVSGAVATITCSPPHFFIGGSEFGLSVGQLQFDFSERYSPAEVIERGQGPGWIGLAIREGTFYAPRNLPVLGDLSGGVKDVLLGSPVGLQGELEIQFGRSPMDPAAFHFEQVTADGDLGLTVGGSGTARTVTIQGSHGVDVTIRAGFVAPAPPAEGSLPEGALQDWTADWTWPDGDRETADASTGNVRHGKLLRVSPIEVVIVDGEEQEFRQPEVTFRFVAAGTRPRINARIDTQFFANVTHIGGKAAGIARVTLEAESGAESGEKFEWEIENRPGRAAGSTYTPAVHDLTGLHVVVLRERVTLPESDDEEVRTARVQLQILDVGELLIGCEAGVFEEMDASARLTLAAVESTFDLSDFHAAGSLNARREQATLDPSDATIVRVPPDGLAQVTIGAGPPIVRLRDRHVQVLMDFDTADELCWGAYRPAGATIAFSQADLLAWAARYPGAQYLIVGRCDDVGSHSYNQTLANDRAARGVVLLTELQPGQTGTVLPVSSVLSRGEQSLFAGRSATGDTLEEDAEIALTADEKSESVSGSTHGRLIHAEQAESVGWPDERFNGGVLSEHETLREKYRRIDIYAIGGTPAEGTALVTDEPTLGADLRRSLVPASGAEPEPVKADTPSIDYLVKLRFVWDSPTVSELKDAIPTLAEAEFSWTPQTMPLPPVDGEAVELSREVLTVFVNWTYDARTGYTKASLGIRSEGDPDGLIGPITTRPLVAALAFGPVLLAGVDANTDLIGAGARVAALLAAVWFARADLGGGPLIGDGSKTAIMSAAFETEMRSIADPGPDMQLRVLMDYVCTLHINAGVLGIKTVADQPMKIRYKRVGIEYDSSKEEWEQFGLVYDTTSMEIEDPGRWEIDGVLGSLLRIVEVAMGRGSVWIEGRIAIALEIGILEITEAIIRLTFRDGETLPAFELRGFVLKADVPGVLEGEGRLRIEDGGVIRAGVKANVIPVGLGADAALALAKMGTDLDPWVFLSLFLGVQFNTPLPLGQSGMAIYGFKGLFTMNGTRALPANPDPVLRELDWWATPPESKYDPLQGQYALGVGVVVGTMPDVSFCVSCAGMLVVAFPDPEVILGVDVKVIEVPDTSVSDEGGDTGTITGLIVIDDEAVKLAASAQYTIPSVLEVKVPFAGYFPYPGSGKDVYVRIGSDGQTAFGRFGQPATLKLLPGTLNVQAWAYLMIEQGGLPSLGGDSRFTFEGFSVGFGAGFDIHWSAGPIKLSASAKVLLGFGTAPLMIRGGVFVAGELDLVVISISARGELILEAREFTQADGSQDVAIKLEGTFCGEVDLWFFSLSGCVGVSIDLHPDLIPPAPPSPVRGINLTDRRDRIMGVATIGEPQAERVFVPEDPARGASVDANNTVWPDTAPVIHFSHYVENAMPAGAQFTPGPTPTGEAWFGSSALKYAYRLDGITLRRRSDGVEVTGEEPLQSVWTTTPYRQPNAAGGANPVPSEHEGPSLKLLDWNPFAWVVNMTNGGEGQPGDPVSTVDDLCDPKPAPRRACVLGRRARRAGYNRVRLRAERPPQPPYPSRFFVTGEPVLRIAGQTVRGRPLHSLITLAGGQIVRGEVVALPFAADVQGANVTRGYRLSMARRAIGGVGGGLQDACLPWEGVFSQRVTDPAVTLMICDAPGQGKPSSDSHRRSTGADTAAESRAAVDVRAASDALFARKQGATVVTGVVDDRAQDDWPGKIIEQRRSSDGRTCELVVFRPRDPRRGPWDGFRIEAPTGKTITLVSVCGIDKRAADARANDVAVASTLTATLVVATLADPDTHREIVLGPGTEYEIAVDWSWQAWQPEDPDEQPPAPSAGGWTAGATDVLRFATAEDSTLTEPQQDGLNECLFDARDIDRYLLAIEPANGRAIHFTDDPVWVHFDAGHVEQLLDQYDRTLDIEIRRTDPPPQPSADLLNAAIAPLDEVMMWHELPRALQPVGYQRLNDALSDPEVAPCVPDGTPMGGASAAVTATLEPDADYDLNVIAAKAMDRPVVRATRFHTSRYAAPRALLDALGYTHPAVAPYLADDLIVPDGMGLPAGAFVEGDAAMDGALATIDAEALPLPTRRPRSYLAWSFDELEGWRIEALVVDSLEPMKRETTVVGADGGAVQGTRIEPVQAAIGAHVFELFRANARWTRVIFKPAAPLTLDAAVDNILTLTFNTSDTGNIIGTRRAAAVPSVIEREGL